MMHSALFYLGNDLASRYKNLLLSVRVYRIEDNGAVCRIVIVSIVAMSLKICTDDVLAFL
jgi:uncharacterized protein YqfB (UPF0267 family)